MSALYGVFPMDKMRLNAHRYVALPLEKAKYIKQKQKKFFLQFISIG